MDERHVAGRRAAQEVDGVMLLKLEARPEPSQLMAYLSPLLAVALTRSADCWCSPRSEPTRWKASGVLPESGEGHLRRLRAAAQGHAADALRGRPRGRLPCQRVEHRRRRPV